MEAFSSTDRYNTRTPVTSSVIGVLFFSSFASEFHAIVLQRLLSLLNLRNSDALSDKFVPMEALGLASLHDEHIGVPIEETPDRSENLIDHLTSLRINVFLDLRSKNVCSAKRKIFNLMVGYRACSHSLGVNLAGLIKLLAGLLPVFLNLLTLTLHSSTPFFEALCITLSASFFKRLLKLLTLTLHSSTLSVEILPLVSKLIDPRLNLTLNHTIRSSDIRNELLLLLSKGTLLILHRTVHSLRSGLIMTQRIDIKFNGPSQFNHALPKALLIPTDLSRATNLLALLITNVTMLAIRT